VTQVDTATIISTSPTATETPADTTTAVITATDTPTSEITVTPEASMTPLQAQSKVKAYYLKGMKAFEAHEYLAAVPYFKKAIAVKDPYVQSYFYAESNAMLGVIYQFHLPNVKGHNRLAMKYYKRALKIDPRTKSARKFLKMLQAAKAIQPKTAAIDVDVASASTVPQPTAPATPAAGDTGI